MCEDMRQIAQLRRCKNKYTQGQGGKASTHVPLCYCLPPCRS